MNKFNYIWRREMPSSSEETQYSTKLHLVQRNQTAVYLVLPKNTGQLIAAIYHLGDEIILHGILYFYLIFMLYSFFAYSKLNLTPMECNVLIRIDFFRRILCKSIKSPGCLDRHKKLYTEIFLYSILRWDIIIKIPNSTIYLQPAS